MKSTNQVRERTVLCARIALAGLLSIHAATLGGCATIVSGTTQKVSFQTSPEDVVVTLIKREPGDQPEAPWHETTRILGKTPLTVELDKEEHQSVVLSKEGYKPVTAQLTTTLDSWFWGNIVFGGAIGSTTDSMSGATHEYAPSQFFVTLTPSGGSTIENATLKSQREKAKEFIVLNHKNLMSDVHQGTGENLSGLFTLLGIGTSQATDALRKIRALSEVYADIPEFAGHVTTLFLK